MSAVIVSVTAERLPGTVRTPLETIDDGLTSDDPKVRQLAEIADALASALAEIGELRLDWN